MNTCILPISAKLVRELLAYNANTGLLTWKVSRRCVRAGDIAGGFTPNGYISLGIFGTKYQAHRIIWLYVYGEWPKHEIDHIDGVRHNNRLSNLRDITRSMNNQNSLVRKGVTKRKNGRFRADIVIPNTANKERIYLGDFDNAEDAYAAYLAKKREIHPGFIG